MTVTVERAPTGHVRDLLRRTGSPRSHQRWLDHVASTRGCVRPIRLSGALSTVDKATGEIVATRHTATSCPDGVIYVPCGDRRAEVCPACAETYRADTYQLMKSGLVGGKGVPESVAAHPAVFATLTAPGFGPVHSHSINPANGRIRPCRPRRQVRVCPHGKSQDCRQRHLDGAREVGRPICLDCYDHIGHLMWNAWAGELWRRTMITLNRLIAPLGSAHGVKLRVSYGKVAEYQRRGLVHFHALIRIDQVDPDDVDAVIAPPLAITSVQLAALLARAVGSTRFDTPIYPGTGQCWPLEWGPQLDVRHLRGVGPEAITSEAVAAYLAKYATKATESSGLSTTARLNGETVQHYADGATHLGPMPRSLS